MSYKMEQEKGGHWR